MLYEVLAPGYHSPLTKTQIMQLFRAGHLGRNDGCKPVNQKQWRTIDELFPLLKYQPATISCVSSWEPAGPSPKTWALVFAFLVAACGIAALWYHFGYAANSVPERHRVTETRWPRTITTSTTADPFLSVAPQTTEAVRGAAPTTYALSTTAEASHAQLATQQREAQERQRQQAELTRLQEERARQEQKARGQDVIIPLDQYCTVNVGGVGVRVKIHDNDVTSFDVWINGQWRREVPKQKGITQSGTDRARAEAVYGRFSTFGL
jgi:hypothetical protein